MSRTVAKAGIVPVGVSLACPVGKRYPSPEYVLEALRRRRVEWIGEVRKEEYTSGPFWVVDLVDRSEHQLLEGLGTVRHAFDGFTLLVLWEQKGSRAA